MFDWVLLNYESVFTSILLYIGITYALRSFMQERDKLELKRFMFIHNLFLSIFSLIMFVGLFQAMYKQTITFEMLFCNSERTLVNSDIFTWYYIFYLSKYYELIDTLILVLRKRVITFIHIYHHITTLLISFLSIKFEISAMWYFMLANTFVHIFMYFYYSLIALGYRVWWKRGITILQISQFVSEIPVMIIGYYYQLAYQNCIDNINKYLFLQGVILSYLLLFIDFYLKTY